MDATYTVYAVDYEDHFGIERQIERCIEQGLEQFDAEMLCEELRRAGEEAYMTSDDEWNLRNGWE